MVGKYTEAEVSAIDQKMESPEKIVICPRCGSELTYKSAANSFEVKCPTKDCLIGTVRGL